MNNIKTINYNYNKLLIRLAIINVIFLILTILFFILYLNLLSESLFLISFISFMFSVFISVSACLFYNEKKGINKKYNLLSHNQKIEFENIILFYKEKFIFTNNYIFLLDSNMTIRYLDIIFIFDNSKVFKHIIYPEIFRFETIVHRFPNKRLLLFLKNGRIVKLELNTREAYRIYGFDGIRALIKIIISKNEKIIVGTKDDLERLKKNTI